MAKFLNVTYNSFSAQLQLILKITNKTMTLKAIDAEILKIFL